MARSIKSQVKVGLIKGVWNETFKAMDYYKKTKRGKFILCNPYTGKFLTKGPGISLSTIEKLQAQ